MLILCTLISSINHEEGYLLMLGVIYWMNEKLFGLNSALKYSIHHTPFVPLITSKKLPLEGLTIFAIILQATHAFKN